MEYNIKHKKKIIKYTHVIIILIISLLNLNKAASFELYNEYKLWSYWNVSDENSAQIVDHSQWQNLLDKYLYVSLESTSFNYKSVLEDGNHGLLKQYISSLANIDPRKLNSYQQLAYWINLHNAMVVNIILDNYPVDSILDINPSFNLSSWSTLFNLFKSGPWNEKLITIANKEISLNQIVNSILLPIWGDRRIHYCLCNSSIGSPDLYPTAFTAIDMPELLKKVSYRFLSQEKSIQWISGKLVLSRLFENNSQDFTNKQDLLFHLKKYSSTKNKKKLKQFTGVIEYQFNWKLNDYKN